MHDTKRQFHDAHREPYSTTVREALDEVNKLMKCIDRDGCPNCGEGGKQGDPAFHLNARLNAISRWLKRHLTGKPDKWKTNIITPNWCKQYKQFVKDNPDHANKLVQMRRDKP